jgi:hypothetical protein
VQLQDAAVGEAAGDGLAHLGHVGAALGAQQQRFGHGADGDADDHLVGQLGELPGAVRADVRGAAEHLEDGQRALEVRRLPPTMMASVPFSAPTVPPETGASRC